MATLMSNQPLNTNKKLAEGKKKMNIERKVDKKEPTDPKKHPSHEKKETPAMKRKEESLTTSIGGKVKRYFTKKSNKVTL